MKITGILNEELTKKVAGTQREKNRVVSNMWNGKHINPRSSPWMIHST